ncbi:MAG: polymer-forming cytoskeletal protein [bacterium]|nr:polymer-forming cytoskeletal protein [bacterium]
MLVSPKKIVSLTLGLIATTVVVSLAATTSLAQSDTATPTLSVTSTGPHFFSGESVVITEDLVGDVYVAGGSVRIDGIVDGDVLAAGGRVVINGEVTQDIRATGGTVELHGYVGQNVTLAGGEVTIADEATINGSVVVAGSKINVNGPVAGNVYVAAETAAVASIIGGDITFHGDKLSLEPTASIAGNLTATVNNDSLVPVDASIAGERMVSVREQNDETTEKAFMAGAAGFGVLAWLSSQLAAAVVLFLFPRAAATTTQAVLQSPAASFVWGVVALILPPILAVLLMITGIGLSLGVLLLLLYIIILLLADMVAGYALGKRLLQGQSGVMSNKYLQLVVGMLLLSALLLIPVLGWILKAVAFIIGLGGLVTALKSVTSTFEGSSPVVVVTPQPASFTVSKSTRVTKRQKRS